MGGRNFYLVTDLTAIIVRRGSGSGTIAADSTSVTVNTALSPALIGAIGDYLVFASLEVHTIQVFQGTGIGAELTSLSNLQVRIMRAPRTINASTLTSDVTVSPEPDTGHSHTLPNATFQMTNVGATAQTLTFYWMIVRA